MAKVLSNLFLGSLDDALNPEVTDHVTHILNVSHEVHFINPEPHICRNICATDEDNVADITCIIMQSVQWIEEATESGGKVLVYCLDGKSRSVCVCIAYMCLRLGYDFEDALHTLVSNRKLRNIDIYPTHLQQLEEYINVHILMQTMRQHRHSCVSS